MQALLRSMPTLAIAILYYLWHHHEERQRRRRRVLHERVSYMLWIMATRRN
ncbi:MAG TPA: hypothetical protein VH575_29860 [Gemmataceae bacterium]|jgi:hypothetical protein